MATGTIPIEPIHGMYSRPQIYTGTGNSFRIRYTGNGTMFLIMYAYNSLGYKPSFAVVFNHSNAPQFIDTHGYAQISSVTQETDGITVTFSTAYIRANVIGSSQFTVLTS